MQGIACQGNKVRYLPERYHAAKVKFEAPERITIHYR